MARFTDSVTPAGSLRRWLEEFVSGLSLIDQLAIRKAKSVGGVGGVGAVLPRRFRPLIS